MVENDTYHLTQFKIEIDNKIFNSLADLNIYVAGIMVQIDGRVPPNFNPFLMEYAQLNGILVIGEPEPHKPHQLWFKFPNDSKVYDVILFNVQGGDIMLHYSKCEDGESDEDDEDYADILNEEQDEMAAFQKMFAPSTDPIFSIKIF